MYHQIVWNSNSHKYVIYQLQDFDKHSQLVCTICLWYLRLFFHVTVKVCKFVLVNKFAVLVQLHLSSLKSGYRPICSIDDRSAFHVTPELYVSNIKMIFTFSLSTDVAIIANKVTSLSSTYQTFVVQEMIDQL